MSSKFGGSTVKISGVSADLNVGLGGALSRSVILFGEIVASNITDPEFKIDNTKVKTTNVSAGAFGIGVGLAYYLPSNTYFSATLASTQLSIQRNDQNTSTETNSGLGVTLQVGQEWWVGRDWGLGVAGQFLTASMKDNDTGTGNPPTWKTTGFGVLCSASYNLPERSASARGFRA